MNIINKDRDGNNVPIRVFKSEEGKYSIGISKKDGEKYINRYFPVEFLKDVEVENGTDIIIKNAFLTWFDWSYQDSKGTKWIIKITAFERVGTQQTNAINDYNFVKKEIEEPKKEPKLQDKAFEDFGQEIEIDDSDLPF